MKILKSLYRHLFVLPALRDQAEDTFDALLTDLDLLWNELVAIRLSDKGCLDRLVLFFEAVSIRQDKGEIDETIRLLIESELGGPESGTSKVLEDLKILSAHMRNAGRNEYGMNRTKPGETVTAENVYVGGKYGIFTFPVREWKASKDSPGSGEHYRLAELIAKDFLQSHIGPMINTIERLRTDSSAQAAA